MSLLNIKNLEKAALVNRSELFRLGTAILFIVGIMLFTVSRTDGGTNGVLLVVAAILTRIRDSTSCMGWMWITTTC